MSTALWKLEKDLCRCCHAEGSFKHLSEPCFQLGQEEIYADMLQECLNMKINPISGALSDITYTICESCIVRLRDASNFKQQVAACEERFKEMYSKNLLRSGDGSGVKDEPEIDSDADMKVETLDETLEELDEDDDDAFLNFDDDDSDQEELPVEFEAPQAKGKGKAKPKPKPKKAPAKKPKAKAKPVKSETETLTEAAVSSDKRKGEETERTAVCEITQNDDGDEIYTCLACRKQYSAKINFTQHYKHTHMKMRPQAFPCKICGVPLIPHKKAAHLDKVHGVPAPTCNDCGGKFSSPHMLLRHQRKVHMREKNFQCDKCDRMFWGKGDLNFHQAAHSEVRNHACDICGKKFKWRRHLLTHMDIHLDVRRHVCEDCGEAFIQHTSLKYHISKKHPQKVVQN